MKVAWFDRLLKLFRRDAPACTSEAAMTETTIEESTSIRASVFVGSSKEGVRIAHKIAERLSFDFHVTRWWDKGTFPGTTPLIPLEDELERRDFGVLVASPDDPIEIRGHSRRAMRDNVLFEFGLFVGKRGKKRTHLVLPKHEDFQIPSDLLGLPLHSYSDDERSLDEVIRKLISDIKGEWSGTAATNTREVHGRGRRMLRFIAWARDVLSEALLQESGGDFSKGAGLVVAASSFLTDDIDRLGLRSEFDALVVDLEQAAEYFPKWAVDQRLSKSEVIPALDEWPCGAPCERGHRHHDDHHGSLDRAYFGYDPALVHEWRHHRLSHRHEVCHCEVCWRMRCDPEWERLTFHAWMNGTAFMQHLFERRFAALSKWYKFHRKSLKRSFDAFESALHNALYIEDRPNSG